MDAELRAHIQQVASSWPQLSREQIDRVATLMQVKEAA